MSTDQCMKSYEIVERFTELILEKPPSTLPKEGGTFAVDHLKVYKELRETVKPLYMSLEDNIYSMHTIVSSSGKQPKDIILTEKSFDYRSELIKQQIGEFKKIESKSVFEENHLERLRKCSKYNGNNEPIYFKMATLKIFERKDSRNY